MRTCEIFTGFVLVFILAFASCLFAMMGWNLLSDGTASIDWETCLALATIIGFSVQLADVYRHLRKRTQA